MYEIVNGEKRPLNRAEGYENTPSARPSYVPSSRSPSATPSFTPSYSPSATPSFTPSYSPSARPSYAPSSSPSSPSTKSCQYGGKVKYESSRRSLEFWLRWIGIFLLLAVGFYYLCVNAPKKRMSFRPVRMMYRK